MRGRELATWGAALLGGIVLVAHLFVADQRFGWVGWGLVAVAVALAGAAVARPPLLALVGAVGAVALGWAVLEVGQELASERQLGAVVGGLATASVAIAVLRSSGPDGA
ncbi:hypothetical protein FE634_17960 [Nocardioides dongxiaopingii]|uniref:hypothetical protein n=1 Tax=Nocardioides TaxID=1839 RepID=UPI0010C76B0B|nr:MULTISPECIES: hypothetical protein [Nocardioides]QCW51826.1 hypothetical protein FE634_17960 [Nocardioides sp. S-1144]